MAKFKDFIIESKLSNKKWVVASNKELQTIREQNIRVFRAINKTSFVKFNVKNPLTINSSNDTVLMQTPVRVNEPVVLSIERLDEQDIKDISKIHKTLIKVAKEMYPKSNYETEIRMNFEISEVYSDSAYALQGQQEEYSSVKDAENRLKNAVKEALDDGLGSVELDCQCLIVVRCLSKS